MDTIICELPLLSIVIPLHNGEKYLKRAVESILCSTYKNFELILVDDGSTDSTKGLCEELERQDIRIKFFQKENGGVASARNFGMEHCRGTYVGFCDQDDEISPDMYKIMIGRIEADNSDVVLCGTYRRKSNRDTLFEQFTDKKYEKEEIISKLLLPMLFKGFNEYKNPEISIYPTIWKGIFNKRFINEKGLIFKNFIHCEDDLIMLVRLLINAESVSTVSEKLYYWNTNMESETYSKKYIENLESKQTQFINYMISLLKSANICDEIINKYDYVLNCQSVLQLFDNLVNAGNRAELKKMKNIKSVKKIYKKDSFGIKTDKYYIKKNIVLGLVRAGRLYSAYYLNYLINILRILIAKNSLLEKWERKVKYLHTGITLK